MATKHLNQIDLSDRWIISHRTLERWRWTGEGPHFIQLGGRVVWPDSQTLALSVEDRISFAGGLWNITPVVRWGSTRA